MLASVATSQLRLSRETSGIVGETMTKEQAYEALRQAAERIGQRNYQSGVYVPGRKGYALTAEHDAIVKAMPQVLSGALSPESAMTLLGHSLPTRLCDYCEEAPATGYVSAYKAHVCEPCYEDHHGPVDR